MKKIITIIILFAITIMMIPFQNTHATEPDGYDYFDLYSYQPGSYGSSGYSVRYDVIRNKEIQFDESTLTVNKKMMISSTLTTVFVESNALYSSEIRIYEDPELSSTLIDTLYFKDIDTEQMQLFDDEDNPVDLAVYKGNYIRFELALDPAVYNSRYTLWDEFKTNISSYVEFIINFALVEIDPDDPLDLELLPETVGSIFSEQMDMGKVTAHIDGFNATFDIFYNTMYVMNYTFDASTDMSIFDESFEAYYYTYEGDKFILFNHGDESMFTSSNWRVQTFIPYTIWNLETNEIQTFTQFNVYMYAKHESANNWYIYFYVDEFIIDRLIQVTLSLEYRYVSIFGTKGVWTPYLKVLEDENINPGSISWQLQAAAISTAATTIGSMIPIIGLPLFVIGTPISLYLQYLSYEQLINGNSLFAGLINEIESVTPSADFKAEVDGAYHEYYDEFIEMDLTEHQLWKLHLGTFNKWFQTGIEINTDPEKELNIVQFRYMTDGEVYTIEGENMNFVFNPGDATITPGTSILSPELISAIILIGIVVVAFLILPSFFKLAQTVVKSIEDPRILLAMVVIGIAIYLLIRHYIL